MTVTLIGIDHDDLHGYDRLLTLLKRSAPDMIVSENDVKTHKRTLKQRQYIHNNLASMARVITEQAPIEVNEKTAKSLLDTYGFEAAAI
jgi:lysophospholipase L1-like esterase